MSFKSGWTDGEGTSFTISPKKSFILQLQLHQLYVRGWYIAFEIIRNVLKQIYHGVDSSTPSRKHIRLRRLGSPRFHANMNSKVSTRERAPRPRRTSDVYPNLGQIGRHDQEP